MLAAVAAPGAVSAADETWQFGTAPGFSSGRYGTDTRTEVFHTPVTVRRHFRDGDLTLVFPFTCITGNGGVTVVNGIPVRKEVSADSGRAGGAENGATRSQGSRAGASPPARGSGDTTLRPGTGALAHEVTRCGMGDIVVRGRYYILDERGWMPTVAIRAHVKAATASADDGLGTGRPDEGIGVEVSRTLGGGFLMMVDGGYTVMGEPAGVEFNNTWWYDVGVGRDLAGGLLNVSVFFEEYRAIVPGLANARDILAAVGLRGANGWRLQVAGYIGLSDGAPDNGLAVGASRRF